jgi:hypothetical protein
VFEVKSLLQDIVVNVLLSVITLFGNIWAFEAGAIILQ